MENYTKPKGADYLSSKDRYLELDFEKEKLEIMTKISKRLLNNTKLSIVEQSDDFARETLTANLTSYVYAMTKDRDLIYYFDRPTFLDWILKRRRKAVFNLKIKDLLLDAPLMDRTIRIVVENPKYNKS